MSTTRLNPAALAALPVAVERPRWQRDKLAAGVVHLGLGAFMRAHLAAYNDAALAAGGDAAWGISGVSLRHADTRDALAPQQGLYALALRDADERGAPRQQLRVIGSLCESLVAPEDPAALADALCRLAALPAAERRAMGERGRAFVLAHHTYPVLAQRFIDVIS